MIKQLQSILQSAIDNHVFPGVACSIVADGETKLLTLGQLKYLENSQIVNTETLYDLASITKLITAILALQLIEEGKLSFDDKVDKYIFEVKSKSVGKLTVFQLLTSLANFDYALSDYKDLSAQELLNFIFQADLQQQQNQEVVYTNTSYILLGLVIEKVVGQKIDLLAAEKIFKPLSMTQTGWADSNKLNQSKCAPTEIDAWRGEEIVAQVHDESAWKLKQELDMFVGSAGVFSTISDCSKLLSWLVNQKDLRILNLSSKKMMMANQLADYHLFGGFGVELNKKWMGKNKEKLAGKTGFTGTMIVWDKKTERGVVMLSNATYPKRNPDRSQLLMVRQLICDTVFL